MGQMLYSYYYIGTIGFCSTRRIIALPFRRRQVCGGKRRAIGTREEKVEQYQSNFSVIDYLLR